MLTQNQIVFFNSNGFLVVEDVLDQATVLDPVRSEYAALLDTFITTWVAQGQMQAPAASDSFYDKLKLAYQAGCDWFQSMDISMPGNEIKSETPMYFSKIHLNS